MIPSGAGCAVIVWWGDDEMLIAEIRPDLKAAGERAEKLRSALVEQTWLLVP